LETLWLKFFQVSILMLIVLLPFHLMLLSLFWKGNKVSRVYSFITQVRQVEGYGKSCVHFTAFRSIFEVNSSIGKLWDLLWHFDKKDTFFQKNKQKSALLRNKCVIKSVLNDTCVIFGLIVWHFSGYLNEYLNIFGYTLSIYFGDATSKLWWWYVITLVMQGQHFGDAMTRPWGRNIIAFTLQSENCYNGLGL